MTDYSAVEQASQHQTSMVLDGLATGAFGLLLMTTLFLSALQRRRALAARQTDRPHELQPGDTVVIGTVDDDQEPTPAVAVDVEQRGREWESKGGWQHEWLEIGRKVTTRPFYVLTGRRELVRVEPNDRLFLIGSLDRVQRQGEIRHRTATVVTGDQVHILGQLMRGPDPRLGGYREAGTGWVLRPPAAGRMLVSNEPLADRFAERASMYRGLSLAAFLILLLLHGAVYFSFNLLRLTGIQVVATIKSVSSLPERRYRVNADWVDPSTRQVVQIEDDWSFELYRLRQSGAAKQLPLVVSRLWPSIHQLGSDPTVSDMKLIYTGLFSISAVLACCAVMLQTRRWYDRRRIDDSGAGPLT